jgi:hypothetical protein
MTDDKKTELHQELRAIRQELRTSRVLLLVVATVLFIQFFFPQLAAAIPVAIATVFHATGNLLRNVVGVLFLIFIAALIVSRLSQSTRPTTETKRDT